MMAWLVLLCHLGLGLGQPVWVNLGPWDPVPTNYAPAPQSDFPIGHIADPPPAPDNEDL